MAYKINRTDEHIVLPDGPSSAREVRRAMKQQKTPEFYELEPAEVIKVYLDEEDLPKLPDGRTDYSLYGFIEARMCISNEGEHDIIVVAPMEVNIKDYPYPGEYVIVVEYFGTKFYTQKLNLYNNVDTNILPGLSKIHNPWKREGYKDNLPNVKDRVIRQLKAEEGDITFNGRFGNSIRFGSNVKSVKETETEGKKNSPNVIIRAGQGVQETILKKPVKEDINKDGSSLWITTDQVVPIKFAAKSKVRHHIEPSAKKLEGKQIILNSDRIVFNSKEKAMYLSSNHSVDISANRGIILEVPDDGGVKLGTLTATQPALGGDQTMKLISLIIDAVSEFAGSLTSALGGPGSPLTPTSLIGVNVPASLLKSTLSSIKKRLDEPKSKTVMVGHIRGPK